MRRGGVIVQVGNLPAGEVSVALGNIVTREIDYRGSTGSSKVMIHLG